VHDSVDDVAVFEDDEDRTRKSYEQRGVGHASKAAHVGFGGAGQAHARE